MPDIVDRAAGTIDQNLEEALAASRKPVVELERGHCAWCHETLQNPQGIFCPAEPGQRESDCLKAFNKEQAQRSVAGRRK